MHQVGGGMVNSCMHQVGGRGAAPCSGWAAWLRPSPARGRATHPSSPCTPTLLPQQRIGASEAASPTPDAPTRPLHPSRLSPSSPLSCPWRIGTSVAAGSRPTCPLVPSPPHPSGTSAPPWPPSSRPTARRCPGWPSSSRCSVGAPGDRGVGRRPPAGAALQGLVGRWWRGGRPGPARHPWHPPRRPTPRAPSWTPCSLWTTRTCEGGHVRGSAAAPCRLLSPERRSGPEQNTSALCPAGCRVTKASSARARQGRASAGPPGSSPPSHPHPCPSPTPGAAARWCRPPSPPALHPFTVDPPHRHPQARRQGGAGLRHHAQGRLLGRGAG